MQRKRKKPRSDQHCVIDSFGGLLNFVPHSLPCKYNDVDDGSIPMLRSTFFGGGAKGPQDVNLLCRATDSR